jgi:hypothetical protein
VHILSTIFPASSSTSWIGSLVLSCLVLCLLPCLRSCLALSCLVLSCLVLSCVLSPLSFVCCLVFYLVPCLLSFYLFFCLLPCLLSAKDTAADKRRDRRTKDTAPDEIEGQKTQEEIEGRRLHDLSFPCLVVSWLLFVCFVLSIRNAHKSTATLKALSPDPLAREVFAAQPKRNNARLHFF